MLRISAPIGFIGSFIASLLGSLFVFSRVENVLPTIFGDELIYLKMSAGFPEVDYLGNALFTLITGFTSGLGLEFYWYMKVVNVALLFLFGLAVGTYTIRKIPALFSVILTFAAVLGPASVYSSFFMPEMLFFATAAWTIVTFDFGMTSDRTRRSAAMILVSAFLLALSSLSKPHALLLAPVFVGFIILFSPFASRTLRVLLGFSFLSIVAVFNIGITRVLAPGEPALLAGYAPEGLDSLWAIVQSVLSSPGSSEIVQNAVVPAGTPNPGFIDVLLVLVPAFASLLLISIGIPSALLLILPDRKPMDFLTLTIAIWLSVTIIGFSYYLTVSGDDHSDRVLFRYIEWVFIFVVGDSIAKMSRQKEISEGKGKLISLAALIPIIAVVVYPLLNIDTKVADSIFASGLAFNLDSPWAVGLVSVVLGYVFLRYANRAFLVTPIALTLLYAALGFSAQQYQINVNSSLVASDLAGIYLYENYQGSLADPLLIVGADQILNQSAIFWSREYDAELQTTAPDRSIKVGESDVNQIVLTLDGISLEESEYVRRTYVGEGFSIYRVLQIP